LGRLSTKGPGGVLDFFLSSSMFTYANNSKETADVEYFLPIVLYNAFLIVLPFKPLKPVKCADCE